LPGNKAPIFFALVLGSLFCYGIVHLLLMRFTVGDVYPPYSSLRSDPVGAEVLHDSLKLIPNLSVERLLRPIDDVAIPDQALVLFLNAPAEDFSAPQLDSLEHAMVSGAHVFVSVPPPKRGRRTPPPKPSVVDQESPPSDDRSSPSPEPSPTHDTPDRPGQSTRRPPNLLRRWKLETTSLQSPPSAAEPRQVLSQDSPSPLPVTIPWHGTHAFSELDEDWQALYATDDSEPVLITRRVGSGRLSLSTDTYLLSNEALLQDRQPGLLAWLVGDSQAVLFDETHFGIAIQPGVMTFVRSHRLHLALLALLGLAALFVWRATNSLVPPCAEDTSSDATPQIGRDSADALTNLVARSLPPLKALEQCLTEFETTLGQRASDWSGELAEARKLIQDERSQPARKRKPAECYNAMQRLLQKRNTFAGSKGKSNIVSR
jgi:hypothetical protein